jgi:membrane protein DedA with SNARE-associated domain
MKENREHLLIQIIGLLSCTTILGFLGTLFGYELNKVDDIILLTTIGLVSLLSLIFMFICIYKLIRGESVPPVEKEI